MDRIKQLIDFTATNFLLDNSIVSIKFRLKNFAKEHQTLQCNINGVINWVATKDETPRKGQMVFTYDNRYRLGYCGYLSPYWEDANPEYWASTDNIKPPCL